jgi:shikimate kinase
MSEGASLPRSLVLIGLMGSGKTTIGRELHHRLGYPLVDMDHLIERRAGKPITAIFAEFGEEAFRDIESAVLEELAAPDAPRRIISTGGGVVVRESNRKLLHQLGYVVWLKATVETILERTGRNRDRPLLHSDNPRAKIEALMEERMPWYRSVCHQEVDTEGLDSGEIATGILESARYYFAGHL